MANRFKNIRGTIEWLLGEVDELEREDKDRTEQKRVLETRVVDFEKDCGNLLAQNKILEEKVHVQEETLQELTAKSNALEMRATDFEKDRDNVRAEKDLLEEKVRVHSRILRKLRAQHKVLESRGVDLEIDRDTVRAEKRVLEEEVRVQEEAFQEKVDELEVTKNLMEYMVRTLQEKNNQLQNLVDDLQGSKTVEPTHRNILYSEVKNKKRLPVLNAPVRMADEVGSLAFGECFAVDGELTDGQDVWLQIRGGWVLGSDAGAVNCVDMTKYGREKYRTRIQSSEFRGQNFPKKMYTEGFPGSSSTNICLISASGDSFWREVNIEMLLRGIATATVFEADWGGDETFTDWVAYYAVNCVQYGQLRTPLQKHLKVTVKPTSRWREYQAGSCRGPDLDRMRDDIGKAQYKECCWLKGMKEQLNVKWEEVEFLTAFAFLRAHCAWTIDDCREAANNRFLWVLQEVFAGDHDERMLYELERAHWLWDEAFDGCTFDEAARTVAHTQLQRQAKLGVPITVPRGLHTASAVPLAWELVVRAMTLLMAPCLSAGGGHSLALSATGTLCAWGENCDRQCSVLTRVFSKSWAAVSAGDRHSLGLTDAGTLHTCGRNIFGQCSAPTLAHGERWVAVHAGGCHSLGLTAAGALHAWGRNSNGECAVPELPTGDRWAAASAGHTHSLGLTVAGVLHVWGNDENGQCSHAPVLPQGECWAAVSAGAAHSLGLTAAGKLYAWGADDYRQCSGLPTLAPGEHWISASAGGGHSLGLTSTDALHAWGCDEDGQCHVPPGKRWLAASAGYRHSLGLTLSREVHAWGGDAYGQVSRIPNGFRPQLSRSGA